MTWNYAYTPTIWPSLITIVLLIALARYAWRRRSVPGASPFAIYCLICVPLLAGKTMEYLAVDLVTKIEWYYFEVIWYLPAGTAMTCFSLEYAQPGRWLTRRNLALLSIVVLLAEVLALTNDFHHLAIRSYGFDGSVFPVYGPVGWIVIIYAMALMILNLVVFTWLFVRSPLHRWPVVIILAGQMIGRVLIPLDPYLQDSLYFYLPEIAFTVAACAIALFGFRILDPIPLAYTTAIQQLPSGMIVLDPQERVVSLNPAAERILQVPTGQLKGRRIREVLPGFPNELPAGEGETVVETSLGAGRDVHTYQLETAPLKDWRELVVGRLVLLHDVTAQKLAQARLLEQERALAMLHEREQLARELHDSTGQVLGYVRLQTQAARDLLARDQIAAADNSLSQLATVAQDAQDEVREYILGAKVAARSSTGFLASLQNYVDTCSQHYQLRAELIAPPDWRDECLEPTAEAQLLRIIQEACTNIRKHAQAQHVQVKIHLMDSQVQVIIQDDGIGFDPERLVNGKGQKYGLGFMRQRAEEVGGSVMIHSAPGQGTRVVVAVPVRNNWGRGDTERRGDTETGRGGADAHLAGR